MGEVLIVGQNYSAERLKHDLENCTLPVGIDVETEGIDPRKEAPASGKGKIVCWSLSLPTLMNNSTTVYSGNRVFLSSSHLRTFSSWLTSEKPKVGHNVTGFDWHMFTNVGINLGGIVADTLVCSRLCNNRPDAKHGLKDLMKYRLGYEPIGEFKKLFRERVRAEHTRNRISNSTRKGIPTVLGTSWSALGASAEVRISEIMDNPSHPLYRTLVEYATLDAKATVELWLNHFKPELESTDYL